METEENKNGKCADCANVQTIRELEIVKEKLSEMEKKLNDHEKCIFDWNNNYEILLVR